MTEKIPLKIENKDAVSDEDSPGFRAALSIMYEGIAAMLPVEGRDYVLNPTPNDEGGVHMEPKAYTEIGKIWLEYLAKALPQYARLTKEEREAFLEKKYEDKS